jgi:hypothetical protein
MTGSTTATINNTVTRAEVPSIPTAQAEPTTIYEQLKQQALANNDLL